MRRLGVFAFSPCCGILLKKKLKSNSILDFKETVMFRTSKEIELIYVMIITKLLIIKKGHLKIISR
jgi:hypothetical protein